jgi:CRP/FNR family transcriptional regulator
MKKNKKDCDLKNCILCRLCIPEWLPAVDANRQSFSLKKGQLLFKEGDLLKGMFFIYSGKVKVHKKWGEDKELIVRLAKDGDIVGHRGMGGDPYYPVSATALEPVTVCFIDLEFFQATLKVNHELLYELMMFYARELKESENNMRNLVHMPVKNRVAYILLQLQNKFGKNKDGFIDILLSKQDLSSFAGAAYETVFRVVKELKDESIVDENGKLIKIINEAKLIRAIG